MPCRWLVVLSVVACGSGPAERADAPAPVVDAVDAVEDAAPDAMPDAVLGCQPTPLLVGSSDVVAQGWSVVTSGAAVLSYEGAYARLQTSTGVNAISGQLLLMRTNAFELDQPFKVEIVMQVDAVDPHDPFDAAAAILGSFTPPFGVGNQREQMIYLDAAKLGWADDSASHAASVQDGADHVYQLSVDTDHVARVTVDGAAALSRPAFTSNGTLAIGDQTNEPNLDSTLRIRSVTRLCP